MGLYQLEIHDKLVVMELGALKCFDESRVDRQLACQ